MTLHYKKPPPELRKVFSQNLAALAADEPSVSTLAKAFDINRTQLNRYLAGDSFPRPDVLARICDYFGVDARIILEPLPCTEATSTDALSHPFVREYIGAGTTEIPDDVFPSGFYRFSRRSFVQRHMYLIGVVHIRRDGANTFMKGFETKDAMQAQNLPVTSPAREFRGIVMQQDDGICILVSRKNTMTCSFNYLSRVASFENNFWVGYVTRTVPETNEGLRATRMVYEYLGPDLAAALPAARGAGFWTEEQLLPFHRRHLDIEQPFQ